MKKPTYRLAMVAVMASLFLINTGFASEADKSIESSAKQSYVFKTFLVDSDIKFQSKDGVVTMTGTVSEETHKQLAQETVAALPGVKSVNNKLELKGEAPAEHSDAWLMMKVKTSLLFHRNVSGLATEVDVKDGIVILRGNAESQEQKALTTEYAKDIEGIKEVVNEMTVAETPGEPDKKAPGEKLSDVVDSIDDASITALVKVALLYNRSTSGLNTKVETNDGVVTLSGKAKNAAGKELAAKLVSDVHGVKEVVNNITVE